MINHTISKIKMAYRSPLKRQPRYMPKISNLPQMEVFKKVLTMRQIGDILWANISELTAFAEKRIKI